MSKQGGAAQSPGTGTFLRTGLTCTAALSKRSTPHMKNASRLSRERLALVGRLRTVVWWRWAEPEDALTQAIDPKAFRVFQLSLL